MNWQSHATDVAKSIAPYVGLIRRIRFYVNNKTLMMLYHAFIHSRMVYALPVWQSVSNECKNQIQILQNKAIKLINFLPILTPTSSLYDNNLLKFTDQVKFECIFFIFKVNFGLLKSDTNLITNHQITNRSTRQSNALRTPMFLNATAQSTIFFYGIVLYNAFIRSLTSRNLSIEALTLKQIKDNIKAFVMS